MQYQFISIHILITTVIKIIVKTLYGNITIFCYVFTGLQMVEEYEKYPEHMYYKCNLCAAHGKLDAMYHHLIGNKHTERYIVSCWRSI